MEGLHRRIESQDNSNAQIFFEIFLQKGLVEAIKNYPGIAPNWDGRVNAGNFDVIYPLAVDILRNAAFRNFSEHSNTYADAHAVSVNFCEELNEMFQCTGEEKFDLISVKSYVDMAVEAGVVEIKNGMVSLTPEDEKVAQSVEREIKGGQN